jgi:hypothetical protein
MKYKKRLYRWHKKLNFVAPRYIFILAILMTTLAGFSLRHNYVRAGELKKAVEIADARNGDTEAALRELRSFVYAHMNANLSTDNSIQHPIQLKNQYDQLVAAEAERVKQENITVNQKATSVCEAQFPGGTFNQPKVNCIQEYVAANAVKPKDIPPEFYKFDFISPRWSPDLAGISILVAVLLWIAWCLVVLVDKLLVKRMEDKF